jgi:hypothetical protein
MNRFNEHKNHPGKWENSTRKMNPMRKTGNVKIALIKNSRFHFWISLVLFNDSADEFKSRDGSEGLYPNSSIASRISRTPKDEQVIEAKLADNIGIKSNFGLLS